MADLAPAGLASAKRMRRVSAAQCGPVRPCAAMLAPRPKAGAVNSGQDHAVPVVQRLAGVAGRTTGPVERVVAPDAHQRSAPLLSAVGACGCQTEFRAPRRVPPRRQRDCQRYTTINTLAAAHITELPHRARMALLQRLPLCSYSQAAIERFEPTQAPQVSSECWLELPLMWMAHKAGR